jgi:acetylornithine aminotransferase
MDHLMNTYARLPVAFSHGEGAWLWDQEGRRYLDAVAGIAVCNLGHAHPAVARALSEQAGRLVHTSNLYRVGLQECLAERLVALAGMDRAFFCNSGAEANEAAIKLARLHGRRRGVDVPAIVVMEGSFHGRTLATLSATGSRKVQAGFEPLVQGFVRVPYNDTEAVAAVARNRPEVVAVLVEPILGEGGVVIPDEGYLEALRKLCDAHDWLLILDEVQTGMGRTGRWLAHQHEGVAPDAVTLAKALGNGVPIGALLARGPAAELMQPGSHGSTFGGNPLAAAAALAVLETMAGEDLPARAARMGEHLAEALASALEGMPCVREIRNRGLMLGIELDRPCGALVPRALEQGLLVNVTAERVIRLLPPLVIDEAQAGQIAATVGALVRELCADDA